MFTGYITLYDTISWTKRYVNFRKTGIRSKLKHLKNQNRNKKRTPFFLIPNLVKALYQPYKPFNSQRRNYNTFYRGMEIPS